MSFFGTNIKKIRQVKGLSQKAFADLFELNRGVISAYEEGRAEPKIDTLLKVAHYFNLDLSDFLTKPLQVNNLVSGSVIDTLMFSPIEEFSKQNNNPQNLVENSDQINILQKILAKIDIVFEFKEKKQLLSNYNIGDFLFLTKANQQSEKPETLIALQGDNVQYLSEIPEEKWQKTEVYKVAGYLSFEQKNVLADILSRIEVLEKSLKN
ncbi:helix-turn-helix domain-containing protein [Chryseobacterium echinoideorum]|uniref:helix-turn-helix domain-containing protein n=1 Tax=Chryseobacterium echinoideorum TaxID=1549648 RepID=UPI0011851CC8|nr:helix-turn-helix transcriptional regulator [Chryseobacterium echinoideorum]